MAGVKKIGAGRAKTAGTVQRSKTKQKPYQGRAQVSPKLKGSGGPKGKPSGTRALTKAAARQKNFAGKKQGITQLPSRLNGLKKQAKGASNSHAIVSFATKKRQNLSGDFTDILKSHGGVVSNRVFLNPRTIPADMVGSTSTNGRRNTKKTSVNTPRGGGSRIQYTASRAFKSAQKPRLIRASK